MSDVLVKSAFQSTYPDTGDATKLGPTAWNAARLFSQGNDGDVPVRDSLSSVGASWGTRIEVLHTSQTQVGTPANLNETDLWTYQLPGGKLTPNGRVLRVTVMGSLAGNANTKNLRLYFGAITLRLFTTTAQGAFAGRGIIHRIGPANQYAIGGFSGSTVAEVLSESTPTETLGNPITIRMTGQNGIAAANDIIFRAAMVELL